MIKLPLSELVVGGDSRIALRTIRDESTTGMDEICTAPYSLPARPSSNLGNIQSGSAI